MKPGSAAVELEKVTTQELRNFDYEKHRENIGAMLQWAFEQRQERLTSGFVEQQRWFRKLRNRVLLLSASNGAPLDVSLAGIPLEEKMIERASPFAFAPDCSLITCSAEDLIVLKAFADRSIDWIDIAGIIKRQDQRLDREYITAQLAPLCEAKEAPAIARKLNQLLSAS